MHEKYGYPKQLAAVHEPRRVSLIGFDDFKVIGELPIPSATVRVSSAEIGKRSTELLLVQLDGATAVESIECK